MIFAFFCSFCFLLFAIRRRLRSHFKNSCFVFHRGFQTLENNKSTRPTETPMKHSHSFLKDYLKKAFMFISSYYLKCISEFILRSIYFATPFGYFSGAKKNLFKFLCPYFSPKSQWSLFTYFVLRPLKEVCVCLVLCL